MILPPAEAYVSPDTSLIDDIVAETESFSTFLSG